MNILFLLKMTAIQPQNPSMVDGIANTSIRQQYERFANSMRITETMAGSYLDIVRAADTGTSVLREGERGMVSMKANENGMISLDNSNIYFEQKLSIKIPDQTDSFIKEYYVGYKDVAGIIAQYQIYSNSDPIQNKTNCDYEWFLKNISKIRAAMKNNDTDATLAKIRKRNLQVPGKYIKVDEIGPGGLTLDIVLQLKVPLTRFLLLNDLRWLADFMGTLSIEMWLSMRNIVIAPVIPEALFTRYPGIQEMVDETNNDDPGNYVDN